MSILTHKTANIKRMSADGNMQENAVDVNRFDLQDYVQNIVVSSTT